jgi:hypothetical protein
MSDQDFDYNRNQKLADLLAAVEIDQDGNLTINGDLIIKGHVKATKNVTAFCETAFSKIPTPEALASIQQDNENLRYENQRLSIINHYHRNEG